MTNNNYPVDIPKIYTVSYFDENEWNKGLTPQEIERRDEIISFHNQLLANEIGYGPCNKFNCKCSCNGITDCSCRLSFESSIHSEGSDFQAGAYESLIKGKIGWDGGKLEIEESGSVFRTKDDDEDTKIFSASAGGNVELSKDGISAKGKLGFDVVNYESSDGVQARIGLNVDTGGSIGDDGIEAKFLGFGVSLGKKNGISTPFGEISKTSDDCVIQ